MSAMGAGPDHLFNLRNNFYLGAYQTAINNSEIANLSPENAVERDCLVFRSYIALGSYQVTSLIISIMSSSLDSITFCFDLFFQILVCISLLSVRSMNQPLLHYKQSNSSLCIYRLLKIR